jgi:hypothetical protein
MFMASAFIGVKPAIYDRSLIGLPTSTYR